ncbi:hypothetical protein SAMN05421780_11920 [Flexibacter flexilis DSM 6793]|uniref:Uncharacterized protein n=1 Tax=Flexibacter flexilis DSM 6793 TaxID=927664 RepID=A0A1I1NU05_9BACT|nr:hypothetical protein [Flexibacter flexilis]SFD00906.1 hypothetical protein SAMN05421780_11920 [Flexibacter flexilis DSM 6793]
MKKIKKLLGRVIQVIVRKVSNLFSPLNYKSGDKFVQQTRNSVNSDFTTSYIELIANNTSGSVNAVYGFRFVPIPFDFYVAVILDKELEDVTEEDKRKVSEENDLSLLEGIDFLQKYEFLRNNFFLHYEKRKINFPNSDIVVKAIEEEFFHHNHVKNTSSWVLSNIFTLCYRISATYVCYRNYKNKPIDLEVSKFCINMYFMQWGLNSANASFIEAYKHYTDDNLNEVKKNYGKEVHKLCLIFKELEEVCENKFTQQKHDMIEFVSKTVINFPFIDNFTKFSAKEFLSFYAPITTKERLKKAIEILDNPSKDIDFLALKNEITNQLKFGNDLEMSVPKAFVYYATAKFIPSQLVWFVFWRSMTMFLRTTKYFSVMFSFMRNLIMKNKTIEDNAYKNLPAIQTSGINGEDFTFDFAMSMFKGNPKSFKKAAESFEPSLLGDKSLHIKGASFTENHSKERFRKLFIHKAFLRAIYYVVSFAPKENYIDAWDRYEEYCLFAFRWLPFLDSYKNYIVENFLKLLFQNAMLLKEETNCNFSDVEKDPIDDNFAIYFNKRLLNIESEINKLENKQIIYWYADANYRHGI